MEPTSFGGGGVGVVQLMRNRELADDNLYTSQISIKTDST